MTCSITNETDYDLGELEKLICLFMPFAQEKMGFKNPPDLFLASDPANAKDLLGKTAYYEPTIEKVVIFVDNRHPKDILRSISHELVHHMQNGRGDFEIDMEIGEGYAQKSPHLREMEKEAYQKGNMVFRDWEDGYKKQLKETIYYDKSFIIKETTFMDTKQWKDRELNLLLMEKWGLAEKKEEILTDEDSLEEMEMPKPSIGLTPDAGMDMSKMPDASEMPKPEMPDVKIDVNESKRQFRSIVREVLRKKF